MNSCIQVNAVIVHDMTAQTLVLNTDNSSLSTSLSKFDIVLDLELVRKVLPHERPAPLKKVLFV